MNPRCSERYRLATARAARQCRTYQPNLRDPV
jgi:hypothetical protein